MDKHPQKEGEEEEEEEEETKEQGDHAKQGMPVVTPSYKDRLVWRIRPWQSEANFHNFDFSLELFYPRFESESPHCSAQIPTRSASQNKQYNPPISWT